MSVDTPEELPDVVRRIGEHGGMRAIHVVPFTNAEREVIGWQNVVVCMDGVRVGLSVEDEADMNEHGDYLRECKERWTSR